MPGPSVPAQIPSVRRSVSRPASALALVRPYPRRDLPQQPPKAAGGVNELSFLSPCLMTLLTLARAGVPSDENPRTRLSDQRMGTTSRRASAVMSRRCQDHVAVFSAVIGAGARQHKRPRPPGCNRSNLDSAADHACGRALARRPGEFKPWAPTPPSRGIWQMSCVHVYDQSSPSAAHRYGTVTLIGQRHVGQRHGVAGDAAGVASSDATHVHISADSG